MHAFSVTRDVEVSSRHGWRRIPAAGREGGVDLDPGGIVVAIHGEDDLARRALAAQAGPSGAHRAEMRVFAEDELTRWPAWPMRLGRRGTGAPEAPSLVDPAPLHAQLASLRAARPGRRRFRVALVGGFGYNLGDTVMGATAWRLVLPHIRAALPDVGADVLLGPLAPPAIADLIGHEPGIDRVAFFGPSLKDFALYDAYFDFTALLAQPRFHDGAMVDWFAWWMGVDPAAAAPAGKRNGLCLPEAALRWVEARLRTRPGPRVAFVWRASVPLRSMPEAVASRFAADLLAAAPGITLVVERSLGLEHPRLLDLGPETDSPERMMAIVAGCDGLIGVDSLAPHVADAADLPTVLLSSTFPAARFPFYPHMRVVVPEGMPALPGWLSTKMPDERWAEVRDDYARSWGAISARDCWDRLQPSIQLRAERGHAGRASRVRVRPGRDPRSIRPSAAGAPFPHDAPTALGTALAGEVRRLVLRILVPGHTAVLAGGSDGTLALAIAARVAPHGTVHALEPRRLRAQKLAADAQWAGLTTLRIWQAAAAAAAGHRVVPDFDPSCDARPDAWGNAARTVSVAAVPLDAVDGIAGAPCHVLAVTPPQDVRDALSGARGLLRDARPVVVAGPVTEADRADLRAFCDDVGYSGVLSRFAPPGVDASVLVAVPRGSNILLEDFVPV